MLQQAGQLVIMHSNRLEKLLLEFSYKTLKYFKKLSQPIRIIFKSIFQNQSQCLLLFPYQIDKTQLFILENQGVPAKKRSEPLLTPGGIFLSNVRGALVCAPSSPEKQVCEGCVCVCVYLYVVLVLISNNVQNRLKAIYMHSQVFAPVKQNPMLPQKSTHEMLIAPLFLTTKTGNHPDALHLRNG